MASEGRNVLRNDDFRKLLATPSAARSGEKSDSFFSRTRSTTSHTFTHKQAKGTEQKQPAKKKKSNYRPPVAKTKTETDELFDESEANLREVLGKYRDRAAERRKGEVDGQDIELRTKLTSGMRPFRDDADAPTRDRDRREQEIMESKYLGGDLEHTHLVKGLDYSLLNKARSEIVKPKDAVVEEEHDIASAFKNPVSKHALLDKLSHSKMTRSICRTLFEDAPPTKNDFFQRGRMAYVVELDEATVQEDVPVTLLRSTFDCANTKAEQNINANNMVVNKLTEVLSYLRSDGKKKKKEIGKEVANKKENIYDDIKEYVSNRDSKSSRSDRESRSDRDRTDKRDRNYFDSGRSRDKDEPRDRDRDRDRDSRRDDKDLRRDDRDSRLIDRDSRLDNRDERDGRNRRERRADVNKKPVKEHSPFPQTSSVLGTLRAEEPKPKKSKLDQDDAYGELFPSSDMFYGGSDDEEDFSKMDMGSKKGPINRWDFESQEDYEKYQGGREAMPKAAFQFGVKAGAGRKTRKANTQAEEKKLDKEFEQIEKIWDKKQKPNTNY